MKRIENPHHHHHSGHGGGGNAGENQYVRLDVAKGSARKDYAADWFKSKTAGFKEMQRASMESNVSVTVQK